MQFKHNLSFALMLAAVSFALPVSATEVLTTSYSAWFPTTTETGVTEWDFNIPNNTYNTANGYSMNVGTYGPLKVTGPDGSGYYLEKNYYTSRSYITLEGASDGLGTLKFSTPAAGLTAFEMTLGISGTAAPITVKLSDGETFTASPTVNGLATIGLSSATAITSFTLSTTSGSQIQLADFFAGVSSEPATGAQTPAIECATAIMIGSGLLIFGGCRKVYSNLSRS